MYASYASSAMLDFDVISVKRKTWWTPNRQPLVQ